MAKVIAKNITQLVIAVVFPRPILTLPWAKAYGRRHPRMHIVLDIQFVLTFGSVVVFSVLSYYVATKLSRIRNRTVLAPGPTTYSMFFRPWGQLEWNLILWVVGATLFRYVYDVEPG